MPGSFSGSLKYIMEKKGYTEELLSEVSWISLSTIKQYRQKEKKEKTLKTVTAEFQGSYRNKDKFITSNCIPMDCDNDHSDDEKDWVMPFICVPAVQ